MRVSVSGFESLQADVNREIKKIDDLSVSFLHVLASEMETSLNLHLANDWYYKYEPREYQRRTDNPSLGIGLTGKEYKSVEINGRKLTFTYLPKGDHVVKSWHTRDDDDLIVWIQKGNTYAPPRPFWHNFIFDMETSIINRLALYMKPYKVLYGVDEQFIDLEESELEY